MVEMGNIELLVLKWIDTILSLPWGNYLKIINVWPCNLLKHVFFIEGISITTIPNRVEF